MASRADAQGFISPYLGWNFGGDSGCPQIANCYHFFQVFDSSNLPSIPGFNPNDTKLDFNRVAGVRVFKF